MISRVISSIALGAAVLSSTQALAFDFEEWNLASLQRRYAKGVADPVPWAGYWWPYEKNGVARRDHDREGLSPLDRLEMVVGADGWISGWETSSHGFDTGGPDWWGHCNGWATAAIMEPEPRRSRTINGVHFSVADLKGILSEFWMESGSDTIGTRVWDEGDVSSYAFWDVIPADFHLFLTNIVGRQHRTAIIDRFTGAEVWNQPLVGYQVEPIRPDDYLGPDPEYPDLYRVNITTTIWWADDEVEPNAVTGKFKWQDDESFTKRTLRYELWLDAPPRFDAKGNLVSSGDIVVTENGFGGVWKNGSDPEFLVDTHPDFIWLPLSYASSSGYKNPNLNDDWVGQNISNIGIDAR
jgi:hypothetical protein